MKIIVCYDESALANKVLREAQKYAADRKVSIDVVFTIFRIEPMKPKQLKEIEERLEQEVQELFKGIDIPYTMQLYTDDKDPGETIVNIAERKKADYIFVGIKKRSKVGKMLFGSTAQHLVLKAPCPVVTVR